MLFWKRIEQLEEEVYNLKQSYNNTNNAVHGLKALIGDLKDEIDKKSQTEVIKVEEIDPWEKYKNKDGLYDFRNYQEKTIEREDD